VIDAKPGSYLYSGMNKRISHEEFKERVENGTITEVLQRHDVKRGDVFYIPAGRVHTIGKGVMVAEVQESSDITYRIFDYNRLGLNGKLRELHVKEAEEAIDFNVYDDYKIDYVPQQGKAVNVINNPYFTVNVLKPNSVCLRNPAKGESLVVYMCIEGQCVIKASDGTDSIAAGVILEQGFSALIPAECPEIVILPQSGDATLLEVYIESPKQDNK